MIESPVSIDELKFDERGLIPAVVTDSVTRRVLMVAYMNRESLQISMEKELTCFWSRSRRELWLKGDTSGNYQHIVSITADCDRDTLLIAVEPDGPACHLGTTSCFEYPVWKSSSREEFSLEELYQQLQVRKKTGSEGSCTGDLLPKEADKVLQKAGEESNEVIFSGKTEDKKKRVSEIADLTYHVCELMAQAGISVKDIYKELAARYSADRKIEQEKITE